MLPQIGNKDAKIMFVLDPLRLPTSQTSPLNKSQLHFLGPFMRGTGLQPKDIYFVSACAPCEETIMSSDKKLSNHIKESHDEFMALVKEINPKLIVALGKCSVRQVYNKAVKVTNVRGIPVTLPEYACPILPMLGLLHVMKQPQYMPQFEVDMQTFAKIVTNDYKITYEEKIPTDYRWCSDLSFLLENPPENLSVDTENIGLYHYMPTSKVLTVQLTWAPGKGVSVPINYNPYDKDGNIISDDKWDPNSKLPENIKQNNIRQLKELLENPKVKCSGHNLKYDFKMLKHHLGIQIADYHNDTLDMVQMIDENMRKKSLDDCARRWVPAMSGYADEFNVNPIHVGKSRMDLVPPSLLLNYGCGDTDCQFRLRQVLDAELDKDFQVKRCYYTIVMPAIRGFCDVELHGQYIDINALRDLEKELTDSQNKLKEELLAMIDPEIINKYKDTGTGLSFNRAAFLVDVLFKHPKGFKLKPVIFTKATQNEPNPEDRIPSTSVKQHLTFFADNPFIKKLTEYVQTQKMLGTYIGTEKDEDDEGGGLTGFYKYIYNGKVYPTFWLSRTVTGRSASTDPNGQNIPKRGKLAKAYRKIFKAPPGYCLLQCDFSQAELRGVAMATHDPVMVDVYNHYLDIHTMTAAHNLGLTIEQFKALPDEKIDVERYKAKAKNFGLTYGMQWRKFKIYAKTNYGIDYTDEEAQKECESWHNTYKNVRKWHAKVEKEVVKTGFMRAWDGRIRHLPDVFSTDEYVKSQATRQAINSPIQSFASDMGLWAFSRLHREIPKKDMILMGFIHDAILAYVRLDRALECAIKVKQYMESNPMYEVFGIKSPIPWVADLEIGLDLCKLHKISNPQELLDKGISKYNDVMKALGIDERAPDYVKLKVKRKVVKDGF